MIFTDISGKIKLINKIIEILQNFKNKSVVIKLFGNLGSGKTQFCKMFIKTILQDDSIQVTSPTFPICQIYENSKTLKEIWHFDLYRIKISSEVWNIGLQDAIQSGLSIIEWAENLPPIQEINLFCKDIDIVYLNLKFEIDDFESYTVDFQNARDF